MMFHLMYIQTILNLRYIFKNYSSLMFVVCTSPTVNKLSSSTFFVLIHALSLFSLCLFFFLSHLLIDSWAIPKIVVILQISSHISASFLFQTIRHIKTTCQKFYLFRFTKKHKKAYKIFKNIYLTDSWNIDLCILFLVKYF